MTLVGGPLRAAERAGHVESLVRHASVAGGEDRDQQGDAQSREQRSDGRPRSTGPAGCP